MKGKLKEVVAGHSYANFYEMYQKMVKIVEVMDENELQGGKRWKLRGNLVWEALTPNLEGTPKGLTLGNFKT